MRLARLPLAFSHSGLQNSHDRQSCEASTTPRTQQWVPDWSALRTQLHVPSHTVSCNAHQDSAGGITKALCAQTCHQAESWINLAPTCQTENSTRAPACASTLKPHSPHEHGSGHWRPAVASSLKASEQIKSMNQTPRARASAHLVHVVGLVLLTKLDTLRPHALQRGLERLWDSADFRQCIESVQPSSSRFKTAETVLERNAAGVNEGVAKPETKHVDKAPRQEDTRKKAHHTATESNPFCAGCGQDHPFAKTRLSNLQELQAKPSRSHAQHRQ